MTAETQIDSVISATHNRAVGVLSIAQALCGLGVAGTVAASGLIAVGIAGNEGAAGFAQTAGVLGSALVALPLARVAAQRGRRPALAVGYGIGAVGAVLVIVGAASRTLLLVYLGCLLVGCASAAGYQARYGATDLAPAGRVARSLSIVVWASTIGSVAGPNLLAPTGNIAQQFGLPQLTGPYLMALFALAFASLVVFAGLRPDPAVMAREREGTVALEPISMRKQVGVSFAIVRANSRSTVGLVAIAMGHLAMVAVMVMTPIHMAHVDVSLVFIGLVISVHVAGMYALSPVVGWAADRFGCARVLLCGAGFLIAACVIAGLAPADDVRQLAIGLFLLGLGWSCTLIAGSALLSDGIAAAERPGVQGLSDLVMNVAGAVGGAAAGIVVAVGSYGLLCAIVAVLMLGLVAITTRLRVAGTP